MKTKDQSFSKPFLEKTKSVSAKSLGTGSLTKEEDSQEIGDSSPQCERTAPDLGMYGTSELSDHLPSDAELKSIFGVKSSTAGRGLLIGALEGLGEAGLNYRSFVLSMGVEFEPIDAAEAMLVTQMAVTHAAMMSSAGRVFEAQNSQTREAYDRIINRLSRTFISQLEALTKYRRGSNKTNRVEHVTVNSGGQAIVGNVNTSGGCP